MFAKQLPSDVIIECRMQIFKARQKNYKIIFKQEAMESFAFPDKIDGIEN